MRNAPRGDTLVIFARIEFEMNGWFRREGHIRYVDHFASQELSRRNSLLLLLWLLCDLKSQLGTSKECSLSQV